MLKSVLNLPQAVYHRYQPGVWVISLVGVLNSIAISLSLPFLALYLYQVRHISATLNGLIILVGGVCAIFAQLLAGVITDKIGRRPLLRITMFSSVLFYISMAVLIGFDAPVIAIVGVNILLRATLGMQRPAIQSTVADLVPKSQLTESYGLMIIGGNLGFAAGPALGGFLAGTLTYAWLFAIGAGIIGTAFLIIMFSFKESFSGSTERVPISSIFSAAKDRSLLVFVGICFVLFLVTSQLISTLSLYTVNFGGLTEAQYGTFLTLNGLMITVFQYPASRFMSRFSLSAALVAGALLYAVGYLTMSWVGPYGLALGAVAIVTAGEICCTPTIMTVIGRLASRNWRGRYMAFYSVSDTLGSSVGPLMGGFLLDRFYAQPIFVWGVPAALAVLAAFGFGRFGQRLKAGEGEKAEVGE
jgi:MFS family permease